MTENDRKPVRVYFCRKQSNEYLKNCIQVSTCYDVMNCIYLNIVNIYFNNQTHVGIV